MVWPVLMLIVAAVVLALVTGTAAYLAHVQDHTPPLHAAVGLHRAVHAGRHRPGGALSVDRLRARERRGHAEVPRWREGPIVTGLGNDHQWGAPRSHPRPPAQWWERPVVRAALAAHDISAVYRLLQAAGYAQKQIAAWRSQSQPEVSAILHGRRVIFYAVLVRIARAWGSHAAISGCRGAAAPTMGLRRPM